MKYKVLIAVCIGGFLQSYNSYISQYFTDATLGLYISKDHEAIFYYLNLIPWFIIWPLSSFYFGPMGDRKGRKPMLVPSMMLMAVSTFLLGVLPIYSQIGLLSSVLMFLLNCVQGFAFGGEFGGAVSLLLEYAPSKKRGFYISWLIFSIFIGILFVALLSAWFYESFSSGFFREWGWRILILAGIVMVFPAAYLRSAVPESPVFTKIEPLKAPLRQLFSQYGKNIVLGIGLCIGPAVWIGFHFDFHTTFFIDFVGVTKMNAFLLLSYTTAIFLVFIPVMGAVSDKFGRKFIFYWGCIAMAVISWPLFQLVKLHHPVILFIVLFFFGFFSAFLFSVLSCFLGELFPTNVRYSGYSVASNIGIGVFETIIPPLAILSIRYYNLYLSALMVSLACIISLICAYFLKETAFHELENE